MMNFSKCLCCVVAILVGLASPVLAEVEVYGYRIVKTYPHDPQAFTEGLFFENGYLYESTGLKGRSSVRQVVLDTGKVIRQVNFDNPYFGEGIASWNGQVYGLTWQHGAGFVWDQKSFELKNRFSYHGEGWGLTRNGQGLIMSDGTSSLRFINPNGFSLLHTVDVTLNSEPLEQINELEWINGSIYANVWQTSFIVRIAPDTGQVTAMVDFSDLLPPKDGVGVQPDVLNGIAYDSERGRLFVTGKFWPSLFEIELIDKRTGQPVSLK